MVNHFLSTCKQGATAFQYSHSCSLYTLDLLGISEALPEVIFIFLANITKMLQMLNAVYVVLNCTIDYAHLELQMGAPQEHLEGTNSQYRKQLSFRPLFLKKILTNSFGYCL